MQTICGLLIVCVSAACGLFFQPGDESKLESLRITWGPDPQSPNFFVPQPLTVEEAKKQGFKPISAGCGEGKYAGRRYMRNGDVSVILIYNSRDQIAGIQMGLPKSIVTPYYNFTQQKMYTSDVVDNKELYTLTAYFNDPKTICESEEIPNSKAGSTDSGLWIQNGTNAIQDSVAIPLSQEDVEKTEWVKGRCFPTMGMHYWFKNRLDSDCNTLYPAFLLYNKGKLNGFGWINTGKYDYTTHAEYPPLAALSAFRVPVPTCVPEKFAQTGGFTTMHVYFNDEPRSVVC